MKWCIRKVTPYRDWNCCMRNNVLEPMTYWTWSYSVSFNGTVFFCCLLLLVRLNVCEHFDEFWIISHTYPHRSRYTWHELGSCRPSEKPFLLCLSVLIWLDEPFDQSFTSGTSLFFPSKALVFYFLVSCSFGVPIFVALDRVILFCCFCLFLLRYVVNS